MKIAVVSISDSSDPRLSSGAPEAMVRALRKTDCNLFDISPLKTRLRTSLGRRALGRISGQYYGRERDPKYLGLLAAEVESRLAGVGDVDLVFSTSTLPISHLNRNVPYKVVATADQLFSDMFESAYFSLPHPRYGLEGEAQERSALSRCDAVVLPSKWATATAVRQYLVEPSRAYTLPWGANLASDPDPIDVCADLAVRLEDPVMRLLFVGKDWERKGGPLVLDTVRLLRGRGVRISLTIVGSSIDDDCVDLMIPFLDRSTMEGEMRFHHELARSHLLFVPSRAEAYGHVFCEAAAFGVPSVTTHVGGIPSIVKHGSNGLCLPLSASARDYADAIECLANSRQLLRDMSTRARTIYEDRLNWDSFARNLVKIFRSLVD